MPRGAPGGPALGDRAAEVAVGVAGDLELAEHNDSVQDRCCISPWQGREQTRSMLA